MWKFTNIFISLPLCFREERPWGLETLKYAGNERSETLGGREGKGMGGVRMGMSIDISTQSKCIPSTWILRCSISCWYKVLLTLTIYHGFWHVDSHSYLLSHYLCCFRFSWHRTYRWVFTELPLSYKGYVLVRKKKQNRKQTINFTIVYISLKCTWEYYAKYKIYRHVVYVYLKRDSEEERKRQRERGRSGESS